MVDTGERPCPVAARCLSPQSVVRAGGRAPMTTVLLSAPAVLVLAPLPSASSTFLSLWPLHDGGRVRACSGKE